MTQSIGSTGNAHKQKGAGDQQKNQPSLRPGQKMSDQHGEPHDAKHKGHIEGGTEAGSRSKR